MENKTALEDLDESQLAAVEDPSGFTVIRAPAGSGKTKTLTSAVIAYRQSHPQDVIDAITFTRAAKAEMEERLRNSSIYDVSVSTIHAWCRAQLNWLGNKYHFTIVVMEEPEIKQILTEISKEYLRKHRNIRNINVSILYNYIMGNKNMDISDNYKRTLNALEGRYLEYKKVNGKYDFTDYPRYLKEMLELYDEYIVNVNALFVDELQDVDLDQFEIFERVQSQKKFYIGDEKQSIYQFRGADGMVFNKLDDLGFTQYDLMFNYRSYQRIIDLASEVYYSGEKLLDNGNEFSLTSLISSFETLPDADVYCHRGDGGFAGCVIDKRTMAEFKNYEMILTKDAGAIKSLVQQFVDKNAMFLCRTNKQVQALSSSKLNLKATTVHQAKGLQYQNVVVVDYGISNMEDLNIGYVALTRAEDNLLVISFDNLVDILNIGPDNWTKGWK